jgi:hypothetical protein
LISCGAIAQRRSAGDARAMLGMRPSSFACIDSRRQDDRCGRANRLIDLAQASLIFFNARAARFPFYETSNNLSRFAFVAPRT